MTDEIQSLLTKRAKVVDEMNDLTRDDGSWNTTKDGKTAAQRWAALDAEQKSMKARADAMAANDELKEQLSKVTVPPQQQPGAGNDPAQRSTETANKEDEAREADWPKELRAAMQMLRSKEYRSEFLGWVRSGEPSSKLNGFSKELRAYTGLNVGTGSQGEYTIPVGFQRELEIVMKAFGGMRRNCRIVPTNTGNALHWPVVDDTANQGRWLSEGSGVSQTNPTFSEIVYNAYLASSDQVLVSVQLLQDSAFDIEALLSELLGIRMGRLTEAGYTTGSGSSQPTGIITQILADSVPNDATAAGSSSNDGTGATGANSIGSDDLDTLIGLVDPSYREGAIFMAHWSILDYLRKVKDKYGRPLFVPTPSAGLPDKIWGYAYDWNAAMDAAVSGVPATGKHSVLFGQFKKYIIRDVLGMTMVRYNELYMPNHQVGFQAYMRTDGERLQQKAFALLNQG